MIWSDEAKHELFGHIVIQFLLGKGKKRQKINVLPVEHGGGSMMVRGAFFC